MTHRHEPPRASRSPLRIVLYVVVTIVLVVVAVHYVSPYFNPNPLSATTSDSSLDWPNSGESAIGVVGHGVSATSGSQTDRPTASTAKLIAALTVLNTYPLQPGQSGPLLTMSRNDLAILSAYANLNGSRIGRMGVGEQLSEYQMLEAMMLPSADNMADSLAIWAYGSLPAYQAAANQYLANHNINDTHVGVDASGLNPSTVSTAHDLVLLGEAAMQNAVLAEIVAKPSVGGFPLVGTITNTNTLLGQNGIVGVKTGNSDQAGGVFVFAANYTDANGQKLTVVGAVQGLPDLQSALHAAVPLLNSTEQNISQGKLAALTR
jgi:serine-type D-Ala-D-Ala carboxypeptidase (penicillin-binding protein 5/6)